MDPVGDIIVPKPVVVDLVRYQQMRKDPVWGLKGNDLVEVVKATLRGFDDLVCFSFVPNEVWIRGDNSDRLNKAIRVLVKAHPSLIPGEPRKDGGGYPYIIFTKYHNSSAPGAEKSA